MTEQPAPYRPNPTFKRVESGLESLIFNSRWLMAPFYFGLVVSLAVLLYKFVALLWEFILHVPHAKESDIILGALSLIDVSLTGNLILMGWLVGVHLVFVVSAAMLALSDRWGGNDHGGE